MQYVPTPPSRVVGDARPYREVVSEMSADISYRRNNQMCDGLYDARQDLLSAQNDLETYPTSMTIREMVSRWAGHAPVNAEIRVHKGWALVTQVRYRNYSGWGAVVPTHECPCHLIRRQQISWTLNQQWIDLWRRSTGYERRPLFLGGHGVEIIAPASLSWGDALSLPPEQKKWRIKGGYKRSIVCDPEETSVIFSKILQGI